ncbi:PREDICTED: E3 ubiquitin protein ligase DRIP2-like isoform X1 [Lupinus angustifolius]|uniref:E3 ubiquitin protein ligase DRIP2-like isoform X1 n=1 Tax=Lupinus angustifolius TaxID=3871 RepID=UPI00092F3A4D|nr:PREDICTED: E3 ubiquitin protein ligase DRIP2-like isoform X1 [Lupinus angustifolius]
MKVRRDTIAACMTCTICNKLFKDATTISECLHTFCKQCIYDKITEEELECCPICNIDLGCVPLEKLRPDHSLQDVRSKVFPLKGRKVKAPEVVPSVPLPARRKERSLSSLVVSTPKVSSSQVNMTGRRTKPTRKAGGLRASSFSIEKPIKNEDELLEDRSESSSSPDTSNKFAENTGQVQSLSPCEGSQSKANKPTESGAEPWDTKLDLWKPLNCLVEVASRTKSFKSSVQGSDAKLDLLQVNESDSQVKKIKNKENKRKAKVEDEKISTYSVSPDTAKPKKLRRIRRKKEPAFGESRITSQAILDSNSTKLLQNGPIWFSLVALENQEGDEPLPQIPSSYVRIKDGSVPVSFIQKYLMKKLDLNSEAEVEIKFMGQTVVPTLRLHNLVELWLDTISSSHRIPATIGSSAKDFVMVLAYARKVPYPSNSQFQ